MRRDFAIMIVASAALVGCGRVHAQTGDRDGGPSGSRNYKVSNFHQIEVAGPYDVEVRTGPAVAVSASGSEKLLERTIVEVDGDKLVIHPKREGWFHVGWSVNGKAKFVVTVPQLSSAKIAGSGDIRVDRVQGASFEGAVAGSGDLTLAAVEVEQLKLSIAGSGSVKAGNGKARSAQYKIAGSGDVDAGSIAAEQLEASIAGSGGIRGHASGTAEIKIVGSGDVDISGGAKCNISKAGSGDVRCS